jgi:hypothetical protein
MPTPSLQPDFTRQERLKLDYLGRVHASLLSASKIGAASLSALSTLSPFFVYLAWRMDPNSKDIPFPIVGVLLDRLDLLVIAPFILCFLALVSVVFERYELMALGEMRSIYSHLGLSDEFWTYERMRFLAFPSTIEVLLRTTSRYRYLRIVFLILKVSAVLGVIFIFLGAQTYVSFKVLAALRWHPLLATLYSLAFLFSVLAMHFTVVTGRDRATTAASPEHR